MTIDERDESDVVDKAKPDNSTNDGILFLSTLPSLAIKDNEAVVSSSSRYNIVVVIIRTCSIIVMVCCQEIVSLSILL